MNPSMLIDLDIPTILIVDDTPSNLSVVVNLFEEHGYRVAIAQDGEEGLQRAQLVRPDLIMLDVMMPGIDGFETCRRLKALESTRDIPVIFMTALASSEHKVKGFEAGGVDYVTKPLHINEVMARVETHLKLSAAQKRLEQQNAQLERHSEELELRVAERTAELNESKERYRLVFENSPVSIWEEDFSAVKAFYDALRDEGVHDLGAYFSSHPEAVQRCAELAKIVDVNLAAVDLHAAGNKEALFAGLLGTFTPESFDAFRQELIGLWNGKTAMAMETVVKTLAGESRNVIVHFSVCPGYERTFAKVLVSLVDITERKRAERELLLLNCAVNASTEAVFLMNEQGRFVYVNEEACRSLGLSRDELLGMTPLDIDADLTAESLKGLLDSIIVGSQNKAPMESRHRSRDGRVFPVEIVGSPIALEGQSYGLSMVRDITERKRAERELHLLNRALDNAFDATYLIDEDMHLRYVNEAAVRALGYSREELLAMTLPDIDPNLKPDMLKAVMAQTDALGRFPGIIETQHRRKDGSVFPIEVGATVFDYEGERLHLTTVRDITERKRAEEALAAHEREFRTLAENIPDTIIRYDAQARKTYVNTAVVSFIGVGADALIGKTPQETLPTKKTDQANVYMTNLRRTLDSGEPQETEILLHHAQHGERVLNIRFVAERDEQGDIVGALMVGRDVTMMKTFENELKEREQRYHEIFDNAVEGMYLLDVTEDGRFRNLDINPALAASTGIPREAMIGKFVDDTVPDEVGKQIVEKYRRCVAAGTSITESIELDLPGGRRHYLSTITPIQHDGRIHRLIGISRDITELKKAERELEESRAQLRGLTARREEAREEERRYIAREVHDELGQILTGLQLNVSVLTHKFAGASPALREQLQETRILTDRALAVARNVASALRPAALDMGIVSALEWLVGRFGTNTGIHCEVHAEDADIQLDESHAIALFRIVQESLTNVARHAKADRVDIDLVMIGGDYSLKVRDNGTGFDQKAAKADSFGLVGMRERALLLGGEIFISSKPGEGTEIEVRIPVHNVSRLS